MKQNPSPNSKWALVAAGVISLAADEKLYDAPLQAGLDNYVFSPVREWLAERDARKEVEKLPENAGAQLGVDKEEIAKVQAAQMLRIAERAEQAKVFKQKLFTEYKSISYDDIFYLVEYFSQGVSDEEMEIARAGLEKLNEKTQVDVQSVKYFWELEKIRGAVFKKGRPNPTKSSVVVAMNHDLNPDFTSCVASGRTLAMVAAKKYPELKEKIFFQEFGDHMVMIMEVEGNRYILENDEVRAFPDERTLKVRNKIFPVWVWLAMYAGHKESEFAPYIETHGKATTKETGDYVRATDNLVGGVVNGGDLGNVGDANSWFNRGNGSGQGKPVDAGLEMSSSSGAAGSSGFPKSSGLKNGLPSPGENQKVENEQKDTEETVNFEEDSLLQERNLKQSLERLLKRLILFIFKETSLRQLSKLVCW